MKSKEAKKVLGVTSRTLYNYVHQGKIASFKINKNRSEYNDEDIYKLVGKRNGHIERGVVTYGRVSLNKQKGDLEAQNERLYNYSISNGFKLVKQYSDIKSGMNFVDRVGFNMLLNDVVDGGIKTIIVENKDRLCRFGFDLFENFCKRFNTEIIVTSFFESKTYEQELTDDLISIIHYFSMKSYSNRRKLNKIKKELLNTIAE